MYDQPAATSDELDAVGTGLNTVTVVHSIIVSDTYEVTTMLEPLPPPTAGGEVGAAVGSPPATAPDDASTDSTEAGWTTPAGEEPPAAGEDPSPPADGLATGIEPLSPPAAEDAAAGVETGATESAGDVPVAGVVPVPPGTTFTPHCPRGLSPGN